MIGLINQLTGVYIYVCVDLESNTSHALALEQRFIDMMQTSSHTLWVLINMYPHPQPKQR